MGVGALQFAAALLLAAPHPQPSVQALPDLPPAIRVVLSDKGTTAQLGGDLQWLDGAKTLGSSNTAVAVELGQPGVKLSLGQRSFEAERISAQPAHDGAFAIFNGHSYRGRFEFFRGKKDTLVVLNVVPLEEYLLGVVPCEMPSNWPQEALRAQAVAARTFAVSRMIDHLYDSYDVYDDQSAQVYLGVRGESKAASQAVRDTAGQILTYQGAPIVAYFFSDAGGYTKDGKQPYLRAKPSQYAKSPHNSWRIPLKPEELAAFAKKCGHPVGKVASVSWACDPVSGYLASITIQGDSGTCEIGANKLRALIGLERMKSTRAHLESPGSQPSVAAGTDTAESPPRVERAPEVAPQAPASLEGWAKPSVASAKGVFSLKLRGLYAWDGRKLLSCANRVFVWSSADALPQPAAIKPGAPGGGTTTPALSSAALMVGADGVVLVGSGYGHGLGMPQYGARELAEEGQSYREILLFFYTGVELVNWDGTLAKPAPAAQDDTPGFYRPFQWPKSR
jgi:stage II sporulation protein D